MKEPHRSAFLTLIRTGAASRDVHDSRGAGGFADGAGEADDAFVARELDRVAAHQQSLIPPLERHVRRARRVLDFGCGTGGTTVALALSALGADEVIGVDANPAVIEAARVRARGHDLEPPRIRFEAVIAGAPLPFPDARFDLVVTVSVLEFVRTARDRQHIADELRRLVAPGGHLYVATPRPGLREFHAGQLLGDLRRVDGLPWASPPWEVARWGGGWPRIGLGDHLARRVRERVPGLPGRIAARALAPVLPYAWRWQKALWRRPR